jgi:cell division protein ZapA (FtsZ GTPase activity inhibitor)
VVHSRLHALQQQIEVIGVIAVILKLALCIVYEVAKLGENKRDREVLHLIEILFHAFELH